MAVAKPYKRPQSYPKVTQEKLDKILEDLRLGSTNYHAALANGISPAHFYNLIAQGIVDLEFSKPDTMQARLVVSLKAIEQEEVQGCRRDIRNDEKGHRGAEWTLEHAYWRHFSKDSNVKELAEDIERMRAEMKEGKPHGDIEGHEAEQAAEV